MQFAIDIETLDVRPTAVICSVAAVSLEEPKIVFYRKLDWTQQTNREVSLDTIRWSLSQPEQSRQEFLGGEFSLESTLKDLRAFLENHWATDVWQWGTMDADVLNHAARQCFGDAPHDVYAVYYRWVRDARTLFAVNGWDKPVASVEHTALEDAQALASSLRTHLNL